MNRNSIRFCTFLLSLALVFFLTPASLFAQEFLPVLQVSMMPQFPASGETIHLTVENYSADLTKKNISWSVNGKVEKNGIGEKSFDTVAPALGKTLTIVVSAGGISKTIVIKPGDIDLIWEANTYVPALYAGKALFTHQSTVTITAVPHFSSNSLIYKWKQNGSVVPESSGYGKSSFTFGTGVISRPVTVSVEVSSLDGTQKAVKEITLDPREPQIMFYENHPLYGVGYGKALDNSEFKLSEKELSIVAVPYYFNGNAITDGRYNYSWTVNGNSVSGGSQKNTIVLRNQNSQAGISTVGLSIENSKEFLQSAHGGFSIRIPQ